MAKEKKQKKDSLEVFRDAPVGQAVLKNAIPAMLAMLMVLIYNLADTFFIGQTDNALMVAAVSLATPVFLIFMALGTIFGIGGTSVISRAMGEGKEEYAKKVCSFCMWSCVVVGVVMSALMFIFMDPILSLIGASEDTWDYAKDYLQIMSLAGPFVLIANCYSNIIRSEGKAGIAMFGQLAGNLLNVILDPIFILACGWNVAGAAIATAVSNVFSAVFYITYFKWGKSMLSINPKDFSVKNGIVKGVLEIGIPAALGNLLMSLSNILINGQMANYGDMAVAGIGVAMKVVMITGMLCIGFGQGVQPLLGYCIGAKNWKRYKESLKISLIFSLALGTIMTVLCYVFRSQIVSAFLSDAEAYDFAYQFAGILLCTSFLFGIYYVFTNALQAMGAATSALIMNISRQGIIYIPALYILQAIFGISGLVWAQPVADVLSFILVVILYKVEFKKLLKRGENEELASGDGAGAEQNETVATASGETEN